MIYHLLDFGQALFQNHLAQIVAELAQMERGGLVLSVGDRALGEMAVLIPDMDVVPSSDERRKTRIFVQ